MIGAMEENEAEKWGKSMLCGGTGWFAILFYIEQWW